MQNTNSFGDLRNFVSIKYFLKYFAFLCRTIFFVIPENLVKITCILLYTIMSIVLTCPQFFLGLFSF